MTPEPPRGEACETCFRIALTGGPGGGKTTAADLFRREVGDRIVVVPEAATILFSGGFPRVQGQEALKSSQTAIYHVQRNLEDIQFRGYPGRVLLCDRGTIDGAAYWPGPSEEFFSHLGTTLEAELGRYDAVLFFETAAAGGLSIEGGNRFRSETLDESLDLDQRLRSVWSRHQHFTLIQHHESFIEKIQIGLATLVQVINDLQAKRNG
ncbi:MAG: AAA family ATPase [Bdellovibrionales bacterium]|nr:AAA family ATPase [Bdellovibrionales bacterium]